MSEMVKNKGVVKELFAGDDPIKTKLEALAKSLDKSLDEIAFTDDPDYIDFKGDLYKTYEIVGDRLFDISDAPNIYDYDAEGSEEVEKVEEGVYSVDFYYYNGGTSFGELLAEGIERADKEYGTVRSALYSIKVEGEFISNSPAQGYKSPVVFLSEQIARQYMNNVYGTAESEYELVKFTEAK